MLNFFDNAQSKFLRSLDLIKTIDRLDIPFHSFNAMIAGFIRLHCLKMPFVGHLGTGLNDRGFLSKGLS